MHRTNVLSDCWVH